MTRPDAVFGNSIHDLANAGDCAARAYPVNPTAALMKAVAGRGWGYFMPLGAGSWAFSGLLKVGFVVSTHFTKNVKWMGHGAPYTR